MGVSPSDARAANLESGAPSPSDAKAEMPEWAPKLQATIQPARVMVGDPVKVTIKVRHQKGISVNLPLQLELGKFTELSRADSTRQLGETQGKIPSLEHTFVLTVAAYELGEQTLPSVEVTALGPAGQLITLKTPPLMIVVGSVLGNEPNAKPKDLEPPVDVFERSWWLLYLLTAVAAIGLVVVCTLLVNRHLRAKQARLLPPPPPVPPHLRALERLAALDLEAYLSKERFKELYLLLSEIVREYVGGRWGFDALEMTTTEIVARLELAQVPSERRQQLELYFNSCDLVKFAKYRPDADVARQAFVEAEELVRQTAELMLPPAEEATSSPAGPAAATMSPSAPGNDADAPR
jgi:hypothetical protein